jgi:hypothetical protein
MSLLFLSTSKGAAKLSFASEHKIHHPHRMVKIVHRNRFSGLETAKAITTNRPNFIFEGAITSS